MALWLASCIAWSAAIAWLAVRVQSVFAPVLLFPLCIGLTLGVALLTTLSYCRPISPVVLIAGVLLGVAVVVAGQHYLSYRVACAVALERQDKVAAQAKGLAALAAAEMVKPPESFAAFMQSEADRDHAIAGFTLRGPWVWAWWVLDAVLIVAATFGVVWRGGAVVSNPAPPTA